MRDSILDSQEGGPKQKGNGLVKSFNRNFGYRSAYTPRPRVVNNAIEPAETVHGEIHKRFGVGRTCRVCSVKRQVSAKLLFEGFAFFMQQIAEDYPGAFLDETSDNACAYSSGAAGNNRNLIVQSELG